MKKDHISIMCALKTVLLVYLNGEDLKTALKTAFEVRKLMNELFDLGLDRNDIYSLTQQADITKMAD